MTMSRVGKHYGVNFPWKTLVKFIFFTLFLLCASWSYNKSKNVEFFPVANVKIFGGQHVEHQVVQTLVEPLVNKGFFNIEIDKIKSRLLQLPWVAQVVVQRIWPNQVVVAIGEKKAVALWNNASVLSSTGELFSPPPDSIPAHLPELIGPGGEQLLMAQYYNRINAVLTPLHFKIARLELTPSMTWSLLLDNGIKMSIGHKDVLTRLDHFVKVYARIVGNRVAEVDYIDLRYPNGLAVRWKSVT